ncbi:glycosyltransferase family 2 protein, partial [uncultured Ruthenibacterium sp.]|uniref:glycosyltransferase family 2 protein n=1 Tax=uncultured Ruthenibacterium sp. TaxID=1905347 RepID=UPI00349ED96D
MMTQPGVPLFEQYEFFPRRSDYCLLIPVINEGERIAAELERAQKAHVHQIVDIVLCDGGSTDGSCTQKKLQKAGVNSLLIKKGPGRQGAQLRCGIYFALQRGYEGVLTIDGNNKDSIEDVPRFLQKLKEGYDFVQGSRYVKGGKAVRTPWVRHLAVHLIHAPIISLTARHRFTDTTNAYRAYSKKYLIHPEVQPLRDVFVGYELLA